MTGRARGLVSGWVLGAAFCSALACAQVVNPPIHPRDRPTWPPGDTPRERPYRELGEAPEEDRAVLLSWAGFLAPSIAGTAVWLVQEHPTGTSVVLLGLGETEGAALGYHYAQMHQQASYGSGLRGLVLLTSLLIALDQPEDSGFNAALAGGFLAAGGLAAYDAARLRHRMRRSGDRWGLRPVSLRTSAAPAMALTRRF